MAKRKDPAKAIAEAVKGKKDADGMVKVYPTEPVGESRVPNVPAIPQEVTAADAIELVSYTPAAFTLYESGNPLPEHKEMLEAQHEAAWGDGDEPAAAIVDQPAAAQEE